MTEELEKCEYDDLIITLEKIVIEFQKMVAMQIVLVKLVQRVLEDIGE